MEPVPAGGAAGLLACCALQAPRSRRCG